GYSLRPDLQDLEAAGHAAAGCDSSLPWHRDSRRRHDHPHQPQHNSAGQEEPNLLHVRGQPAWGADSGVRGRAYDDQGQQPFGQVHHAEVTAGGYPAHASRSAADRGRLRHRRQRRSPSPPAEWGYARRIRAAARPPTAPVDAATPVVSTVHSPAAMDPLIDVQRHTSDVNTQIQTGAPISPPLAAVAPVAAPAAVPAHAADKEGRSQSQQPPVMNLQPPLGPIQPRPPPPPGPIQLQPPVQP
ncbi:unnamed protein product, partial [Sphagnum jensenii]